MWEDPIVKEVRESGAKLAKECDFDMHKLFEMLRKHQKESGATVVTKEELKRRECAEQNK